VLASIASPPAASLAGKPEDFARFYSWYCGQWQIEKEQDGQKETLKGQGVGTPVVT
tara:strand:- start:383 stop:550 length:168 start_codon:yes stop_codon:yes gene_type:complete